TLLYVATIAVVIARHLTGRRYGDRPWQRISFNAASILLIALGVRMTGGIDSDLWLVYFVLVIAETLDASERTLLVTGGASIASYVVATWQRPLTQAHMEQLATHVAFLALVA